MNARGCAHVSSRRLMAQQYHVYTMTGQKNRAFLCCALLEYVPLQGSQLGGHGDGDLEVFTYIIYTLLVFKPALSDQSDLDVNFR